MVWPVMALAHPWFDKPVLSLVEGLTTNGRKDPTREHKAG
jgi:hypothetical protein